MELKLNTGRIIKFKHFLGENISLLQGDIHTLKLYCSYLCANSTYSPRKILRDLTFAMGTHRTVELDISVITDQGCYLIFTEYHRTTLAAKNRANKLNRLYGDHTA